jgi:transcriptional regulator with XRE-family HTH domain
MATFVVNNYVVGMPNLVAIINNMKTLGERLRYARVAAGLTQEQVANELGIKRVSVTVWEKDGSRPDPDRIPAILKLFGVTYDWLWEGKGDRPPLKGRQGKPELPAGQHSLFENLPPGGHNAEGPLKPNRLVPLYGAALTNDGLTLFLDPIDRMAPPPDLLNVRDAYGILIVDESMSPAFEAGDTCWINPYLQLRRLSDVILYHRDREEQSHRIMIKRLVSWSDTEWNVAQYNPPRETSLSREEWPHCHRIVGKKSF